MWSSVLWNAGHRFARYLGLYTCHPYRSSGGQSTLHKPAQERKRRENEALKRLAGRFPTLIRVVSKPTASAATMAYHFCSVGGRRLLMHSQADHQGKGRRPEQIASRAMTAAERQRLRRTGTL